MTTLVRTSDVDGVVVSTALGSIALHAGDFTATDEVEAAALVIAGEAEWAETGAVLRVGDGVHGPAELSGEARLLVLTSRHPAPADSRTWRFSHADGHIAGDHLLADVGGFADMGVRWLATTDTLGTAGLVVATSTFAPGGHHEPHRHPHADEFFLVLRGGGYHHAPDGPVRLDPGDLVHVPAGEPHGFATDPGTVTTALYGYLGAGGLDQAGYEVEGGAR
ncbi:cupin domain-containing protein [Actinosynnema sp. CA-248983]